ncbi:MAG: TIGR02206 family membrane protein [Planctomycetota bacterium]
MNPFRLFGPDHLAALGLTAALSILLVVWTRRAPGRDRRAIAYWLIGIMLTSQVFEQTVWMLSGTWRLKDSLPVELCDFACFATVIALWTRRQDVFEFAYFWGFSGTLQALLTPALAGGFPDSEFFRFFAMHSGIVVALFVLTAGSGMAPRPGAARRVFFWTVAYAVCVGVLDWIVGANYFYLRDKPSGSLLDLFGPWPFYILGGLGIAALLFFLLTLPYRRRRNMPRVTSG